MLENLKGKIFSRLRVIKRAKNKYNRTAWHCLCACGKTKVVTSNHLKKGVVKSCGCLRAWRRKTYIYPALDRLYSNYKAGATRRGLSWQLGKTVFKYLVTSDCFFCGAPPEKITQGRRERKQPDALLVHNGIDRLDNVFGYVTGNCVPCCAKCNWWKRNFKTDAFLVHVIDIYRFLMKETK